MRQTLAVLVGACLATASFAGAQVEALTAPKSIEAGSAFAFQTAGSGRGTLYIVGPGQVLKRDVQLGGTVSFPAGSLLNAGRYLALLARADGSDAGSSRTSWFDVVPGGQPAKLSFLARPSRLPVALHDGITGAVYAFDAHQNLIVAPLQISFELTNPSGTVQRRSVTTRNGAAWTAMDSSAQQGADRFVAKASDISATRVVGQVPGDPCHLHMNVSSSNNQLQVETDPVRDCSGNPVSDGTIVTFTETNNGDRTTVDVPVKRGVAKADIPAVRGATITVASGVSLGNQVRWEK